MGEKHDVLKGGDGLGIGKRKGIGACVTWKGMGGGRAWTTREGGKERGGRGEG